MLAGLLLIVPGLAAAAFLKIFVDQVLVAGSESWLEPVATGLVLAALVAAALTWIQQATLLRLSTKLSLSMSTRFLAHVLRLPTSYFEQRHAGHVVTRLQLNDLIAELLSSQLATSLLSLVTVVFYLALMATYDLLLTGLTIVFALANLLALRAVARQRADVNRRVVSDTARLQGIAMAGLQNIETVKATGAESDFFARWAGQQAKVVNARQQLGLPTQVLMAVPTLLAALNTAAILGFGGWRVMEGSLSLGSLVAFQSLAIAFNAPIANLVALGATLQEMEGNLANVDDVLRHPVEPERPRRRGSLPPRLSGALELRGVTFGYSPLAPPVVEDLSLTLRPGDRVALVGPSGCGKSHARAAGLRTAPALGGRDPPRRDPARRDPARDPRRLARPRRPGHRAVRGDRPRQPLALGPDPGRDLDRRRRAGRDASTTTSSAARAASTARSRRAGATGAAVSASGWRSPARSPATPRCSCSTRRPARSTRSSSGGSTSACARGAAPA